MRLEKTCLDLFPWEGNNLLKSREHKKNASKLVIFF